MDKQFVYLASFKINQDSDFYIEDYKDLNWSDHLYRKFSDALEDIKHHLKRAIETFNDHGSGLDYVKARMVDIYNSIKWEEYYTDYTDEEIEKNHLSNGSELFYVSEDLGNYEIEYIVKILELD